MIDKFYISVIGVLCALAFTQQVIISSYKDDLIKAQEIARAQSAQLSNDIEAINNEHNEEMQKAQTTIDDLRRRIMRDGVRVPSSRKVPHSSAIADQQTKCDIDPRIAGDLLSLAERGDRAIIDLNKCIDAYNAVREAVNK